MTRYGLICLLLGSVSWGQATSPTFPLPAVHQPATPTAATQDPAPDQRQRLRRPEVSPDAPVITISGLCGASSENKAASSACKTVITRAQFEKLIDAIEPNMPARARQEFALRYADALVMSKKAEQMGLDKTPDYREQMKLAHVQVLSQELKKSIQGKVFRISDKDIEDYYRGNIAKFEKAEMERIYVPKTRQLLPVSGDKLSDAGRQQRSSESEQAMKDVAYNLRARALAGEAFATLQADAYTAAGVKNANSNPAVSLRRTSLPPNQVSVMNLKPGEVSSVFEDSNDFVIYKIKSKDTLPLNQAREEIKATLSSQRMQDEMRRIQDSATLSFDDSYFFRGRLPGSPAKPGEPTKASATPHLGDLE